jgi:hypothetical protein
MKLNTIDSAKITWTIYQGSSHSDFVESYCADGDGLIAIHKRLSGVYAIFADISPDPLGIFATLEEALAKGEELLLEHYPEVYEEAMHWNDSPTCDYWLQIESSRQTDSNSIPLDRGQWAVNAEGAYYLDKTVPVLTLADAIYEAAEVDAENGTDEDGTHYGKVLEAIEPIFNRTTECVKATIDGITYTFTLSRCQGS